MHNHANRSNSWNFDEKPLLVFWETTKACNLSCKHCRAEAIPQALPDELTHEEGIELINQIVSFPRPYPILILTGGDVLMRDRLFELIAYAHKNELHVSVAPSITPLINEETIQRFQAAGVEGMSLSLDGASKETHDQLRMVDGTFARTLEIARCAVDAGLTLQINTAVMRENIRELPAIFKLIHDIGVNIWEVFFLVRTGRGSDKSEPTPEESEAVCQLLYFASQYGIIVRTVEGPFFRRVVLEHAENKISPMNSLGTELVNELQSLLGPPTEKPRAGTAGTRDGRGIVFVAQNGDVMPGGFLPLGIGNVRCSTLPELYRNAPLMRQLRDNSELGGRCGICEYKDTCGGSRARAYAACGDVMAEDPCCAFQPV